MVHCNYRTQSWTRQTLGTCTQFAVRCEQKTQNYSNTCHCVKPLLTNFWWTSRTLGQCQVTNSTFCTGFQWRYISSNAEYLRLPEEMIDSLRTGRSGVRIPFGGEIFHTRPDRTCGSPSLLLNGYRVFHGGKSGSGVMLTTHTLLVPRSWRSRAIPLLPLWDRVACYRVKPYHTYVFS